MAELLVAARKRFLTQTIFRSQVAQMPARRNWITQPWNLLQNAKKIRTAKGKKIEMWDPREDSRELVLKAAMGPSGNLRAPTVRIGDEFFIGFNPDLYAEICKRM